MRATKVSSPVSEDLQLASGSLAHQRAQRPAQRRTHPEAEPASTFHENTDLSKFFFALSTEIRRDILYLLKVRECSVSEIVSHFELSQPTMSHHLSILKEANLVVNRRVGQRVFYRLTGDALTQAAVAFFGRFRTLED